MRSNKPPPGGEPLRAESDQPPDGAIHVYGGDFFALPRSEWDPERLIEQPFDVQKALALFEESNRRLPSP